MFKTQKAKLISDALRTDYRTVRTPLQRVFRDSVLRATGEVDFFRKLIGGLSTKLSELSLPELRITCRTAEVHQKPIVHTIYGNCELGDLLVVVKYKWVSQLLEAKSIIYQVKLSANEGSTSCSINQTQLDLLSRWPTLEFGRNATGYTKYTIKPKTLEFGSYMLEPRSPSSSYPVRYGCYGVCPYAESIRKYGPATVNIDDFRYTRGDASNFFSHIAFEIGEHHGNRQVKNLVNALYRFVGLEPDPPEEFEDFASEERDDASFAIFEITVSAIAGSELVAVFQQEELKRLKLEECWQDKHAA